MPDSPGLFTFVVSASTLLTGLKAYYKLEDLNDSVGGLTLTNHNTVTFTAGKVNNAANFVAASTQYLTRADNAAFQMGTGSFTISCWVKFTTTSQCALVNYGAPLGSTGYGVFASGGGLSMYLLDGTTFDGFDSAGTYNDNNWHFIVAMFERTVATRAFIDNVTQTPGTGSATASINNANGLSIGGATDGLSQLLTGSVDEVGIWNRLLTAGERTSLWNGGAGITYPF